MKELLIKLGKVKSLIRWGVMVAVLLILGIAFNFLVVSSHNTRMKEMQSKYDQGRDEINRMKVVAAEKNSYLDEIERLNRNFRVASSMLPDKKEIPSLLKKISEEAEKHGLDVDFFDPLPEIVKGFYAEVPVQIKVRGTFAEVLSFFDAVNKLARIVTVNDVKIASLPPEKGGKEKSVSSSSSLDSLVTSSPTLNVEFKATTFRFIPEAEQKSKEGTNVKKK